MKQAVDLLRRCREARRDLALRALTEATDRAAAAHAEYVSAKALWDQAVAWQADLMRRNGAGFDADWRSTILPGCDALIAKRMSDAYLTVQPAIKCRDAVKAAREDALLCERALLRTGEMQGVLDEQDRAADLRQEELNSEEFAMARAARPQAVPTRG